LVAIVGTDILFYVFTLNAGGSNLYKLRLVCWTLSEENKMFEVAYMIKDTNGYIKEHKAKFEMLQDAIRFVRSITHGNYAGSKIIGKPCIERI
jgi:hypothetical protein